MKYLLVVQFVLLLTGFVAMSVGAWKRESGKPAQAGDDPAAIDAERHRGRIIFRLGQAAIILGGAIGAVYYFLPH